MPSPRRPSRDQVVPDISREEAARRLKAARVKAGFKKCAHAAYVCGISVRYMQDLEKGKRVPSWPKLLTLMSLLKLDPGVLFPEIFRRQRNYVPPVLKVVEQKKVVRRKPRKKKEPRPVVERVPTAAEASDDLLGVAAERVSCPGEVVRRSAGPGPAAG